MKRTTEEEEAVPKKIKFSHDDDDEEPIPVVAETPAAVEGDATKVPKKKRKGKGAAKKAKAKEERLKAEAKAKEERIANGGPEKLPTPKEQAAEYLKMWKSDRANWKFQKSRQLWILRHLLDQWNIADDDFKIAVKYCKDLPEGNARTVTLGQMKEVIVKGETVKPAEGDDEEEDKTEKEDAPAETEDTAKKGKAKKSKDKKAKSEKKGKGDVITEVMLSRAWKLVKALEKEAKE
ncbi:hypothetical protein HDU98_012247 [Podochytrium sp. JEL0797]|nr:hypothetical protein HDU98_012247 [Podochytrium sp. JEL0797]